MPGPEPKKRVKAIKQPHGILVPISRSHLREMGVDPESDEIEINRYAYHTDRAEMRLRFYPVED